MISWEKNAIMGIRFSLKGQTIWPTIVCNYCSKSIWSRNANFLHVMFKDKELGQEGYAIEICLKSCLKWLKMLDHRTMWSTSTSQVCMSSRRRWVEIFIVGKLVWLGVKKSSQKYFCVNSMPWRHRLKTFSQKCRIVVIMKFGINYIS